MRKSSNYVTGLARWSQLLHSREHWKPYHSAWAMAHSWNAAKGLPPEIAKILGEGAKLIGMEPEHPVAMPGRGGPSWCNVFALVQIHKKKCALVVEGNVDEPFGPLIGEWLKGSKGNPNSGPNRLGRLEGICSELGIEKFPKDSMRYQFFHKSLAAIRRAKNLGTDNPADMAAMIVQSFSRKASSFDEFTEYCSLFGIRPKIGELRKVTVRDGIPLFLGWVEGSEEFLR